MKKGQIKVTGEEESAKQRAYYIEFTEAWEDYIEDYEVTTFRSLEKLK